MCVCWVCVCYRNGCGTIDAQWTYSIRRRKAFLSGIRVLHLMQGVRLSYRAGGNTRATHPHLFHSLSVQLYILSPSEFHLTCQQCHRIAYTGQNAIRIDLLLNTWKGNFLLVPIVVRILESRPKLLWMLALRWTTQQRTWGDGAAQQNYLSRFDWALCWRCPAIYHDGTSMSCADPIINQWYARIFYRKKSAEHRQHGFFVCIFRC